MGNKQKIIWNENISTRTLSAYCGVDLEYRISIRKNELPEYLRGAVDANGYCLLDEARCPFYHTHKGVPYCRIDALKSYIGKDGQ